MCSWTPKISCTTRMVGNGPPGVGHRAIRGKFAALNGNLHFGRHESVRIGGDGLGRDRQNRECESGGEAGHHEFAARELARGRGISKWKFSEVVPSDRTSGLPIWPPY